MPSVLYSDFHKLLVSLLNGSAVTPLTLYVGLRNDIPGASDALNTLHEITGGGYTRQSFRTTSLTVTGAGTTPAKLMLPTLTWTFTGFPTYNYASHWFLTDSPSGTTGGGHLYASGPLNPSPLITTLQAPVVVNASTILVPTAAADAMGVYDNFNLGTPCGGNGELVEVTDFDTPTGGNTPLLLAASTTHAHASGASISRECAYRLYASGSVETLNATITLM